MKGDRHRSKKILVFGATGPTGRQIVAQALEAGHAVTAFARNPQKLSVQSDRLRVITGDVAVDSPAVAETVRGQDAVISALGVGKSFKSNGLIAKSMRAIVPAMEKAEVRRFVLLSACGVGESWAIQPLLPRIFQGFLLKDIFADKLAGENLLRASGLDWTIVHPTGLTNGPKTGRYRHGEKLSLRGFPTISRADVAHFILTQIEDASYLKKGAVVSY